jgi:hypothetical protein
MIVTRREDAGARAGNVDATGRGAVHWLGLAAAPTFAIMGLLTGVLGGGAPDVLCWAVQDASPLSGMAPMYLLMSAFHSAPWLARIDSLISSPRERLPARQRVRLPGKNRSSCPVGSDYPFAQVIDPTR